MWVKKIIKWSGFPALLLFLIFSGINTFISKGFMSYHAWISFLQSVAPIVILAIGQSVVILGGGIDISVGATVSLVNVIMVTSSGNGDILLPLIFAILVGVGIGVLNGLFISVLKISPLLVTFAVSYIAGGIALTILPYPGGTVSGKVLSFFYSRIFGFIPAVFLFIILPYILWLIWKKSVFGTQLYALGNDIYKAFFSGIKVVKLQFLTYVFSGLTASIAGIAISSHIGAGDARVGSAMTMTSIAACIIGGIELKGGSGQVGGSIFGALFINLLIVTVMGMGVSSYHQSLVSGIILVLAILGAVFARNHEFNFTFLKNKSINRDEVKK